MTHQYHLAISFWWTDARPGEKMPSGSWRWTLRCPPKNLRSESNLRGSPSIGSIAPSGVPAGKNPQCSVNFINWISEPDHAVKGSTTYLPNAEGRAVTASTIAAASTAPHVSLSPASHIAETTGDEIEVIIPCPTPHGRRTSRHRDDEEEEKEGHACGCSCGRNRRRIDCNANADYCPRHKEGQGDRQEEVRRDGDGNQRFHQVKSETLYSTEGNKRGNSIQTLGRSALRHDDGTGKWMPAGMTKPSKVAFVRVKRDLPATFLYTLRTTPPSCVEFGLL